MFDIIIEICLFFIIFTTIVVAHEGGHCIIAKKSGIRVNEFMVGVGPVIAEFTSNETRYTLRLLPLGGACIYDSLEESENKSLDEHSFSNANVWDRIATVFAGPFFNFLLAFFFSLFIVGSIGVDKPVIYKVMDDYPAKEAGIKSGDEIISLNNDRIRLYRDISMFTMFYESGESVEVKYKRDGEIFTTTLTPKYNEEEDRYLFGFAGSMGREKVGPFKVIGYSAYEVKYWIVSTVKGLGMMLSGSFSKDDLAGPVGVAQVVGDTYKESKQDGMFYVWLNMLNIAVLLSANLGVMNLLPIPAFDGGRLVLLFIEVIRRKKADVKVEAAINVVGMVAILALMGFVMVNDISRFFR